MSDHLDALFLYLYRKKTMTFDEAIAKCEQIKDYTIGLPIKGKNITSLFIGPTDWNRMCDYMNAQNEKGHEIARIEFAGESFSVYGVSTDDSEVYFNCSLMILDDFDKMISN